MKIMNVIVPGILSLFLIGSYAYAADTETSEGMMDMSGQKMGQGSGMEMMKARQQMMTGMMETLRETMSILKDLNHQPSDEERKKLGEMITRIDTMISRQQEMQEKMREKMKERMEMRKGDMNHDK